MLWLICKLSIYHVDISLFNRGYFNQLFNHVFYWLSPLPVLCWCYFAAAPYMEIPMILIRLEITMPMTEQRMMRRKMESNWITIPTWTKKHGPDGQNLTLTCSTRYLEINYPGNCFHVEYPFFVLTFCLRIYGKLNFFYRFWSRDFNSLVVILQWYNNYSLISPVIRCGKSLNLRRKSIQCKSMMLYFIDRKVSNCFITGTACILISDLWLCLI
jgi:hypothetical protein